MTLPPTEFEKLVNDLDSQIDNAKKAAADKLRREELERKLKEMLAAEGGLG